MPTPAPGLELLAKANILLKQTFVFHSQSFYSLMPSPNTWSARAKRRSYAYEETGYKDSEREGRQERQHPYKKTLGTHDTFKLPGKLTSIFPTDLARPRTYFIPLLVSGKVKLPNVGII
jgi:hypothetical protein